MPVTIQIEDRVKKSDAAAAADLNDYVDPQERSEGSKAFWLWAGLLLVVSVVFMAWEATRGVGIGILVWWLASAFGYFILAPRFLLRRLRMHGAEYQINARTQPHIKTLLSKASTMLGISEPEAFLVKEGPAQVRIVGRKDPYFLVITQEAVDCLQTPELDALILRALVQARQNQVSRWTLLNSLDTTQPALRLLVWPAVFYGFLLRIFWQQRAEATTDRLALLLMKNAKLLSSAILKQFVLTDADMQIRNISSQDVDNYIRQEGTISLEGAEISTAYKLGSAIHEKPELEERLQAIGAYSRSPEFAEAVQKLAQSRASKTPTGFFPAPDAAPPPSVQNPPRR
jgi:Zn-dependent protease with chaperone function